MALSTSAPGYATQQQALAQMTPAQQQMFNLSQVMPAGVNSSQSQQQMTSDQQSTGTQRAATTGQSTGQSLSSTYIPEYSQTPILQSIALQAQGMAAPAYQWGIDQYNKNQGNIDQSMRNAQTYASPQRTQAAMGQAEAGVQQGAEAGRQSSVRDLQSYGIDPSAGRYAALDTANRVTSAASAAGAGNQQRMATEATGRSMVDAATSQSLQNNQLGYGAANSANALLGTASQLKYDPLGTASSSAQQQTNDSYSTGDTQSTGTSQSTGMSNSFGTAALGGGGGGGGASTAPKASTSGPLNVPVKLGPMAAGGSVDFQPGGDVSYGDSPSRGAETDDVEANLNAGEFVIPKDVAAWKGQEFFYKLMAEARKMRAMAGQNSQPAVGYGAA